MSDKIDPLIKAMEALNNDIRALRQGYSKLAEETAELRKRNKDLLERVSALEREVQALKSNSSHKEGKHIELIMLPPSEAKRLVNGWLEDWR